MICPPVACCCKGPWLIAPGEAQPLTLSWARWLASGAMGGFTLTGVAMATLIDQTTNPPEHADETVIRIITGLPHDAPADNADASEMINIQPQDGLTSAIIEVAPTAKIGSQYRFNICVKARDCNGRSVRMCDCVMIVVAEC